MVLTRQHRGVTVYCVVTDILLAPKAAYGDSRCSVYLGSGGSSRVFAITSQAVSISPHAKVKCLLLWHWQQHYPLPGLSVAGDGYWAC